MSNAPYRVTGAIVEPPRWWLLIFAGLFALYVASYVARASTVFGAGSGWIALGLVGAFAVATDLRALVGWKPVCRRARFLVDPGGGTVECDETITFSRHAIAGIEVREVDGRLLVEIDGHGHGRRTLAFRSHKRVARLLEAISTRDRPPVIVAPSRVAALPSTATVLGPIALIALAIAAVVMSFVLPMPSLLPIATLSLAALGAGRAALDFAETHIRVHDDGIEWRWLNRHSQLPFERIASFGAVAPARDEGRHAIAISTTDGRSIVFATHGPKEQRLLLARLERGVGPTSSANDALAHTLRRAGRSTEGWIAFLRSVGGGANATPRVAAISPDALERLARDPKAHARDRAAAAVALAAVSDSSSLDRVRIAVEGSTVPALRRVVLASDASSDDDASLIEALAELEDDPRRGSARRTET